MKSLNLKLYVEGKTPSKANRHAAAMDLKVRLEKDVVMLPGDTYVFSTGIYTEIPEGFYGMVVIRSGLGFKGLCLTNGVGIIDEDYRGEWKISVTNIGNNEITIQDGDRVAQVIFMKYYDFEIEEVASLNDLSKTERGDKGFGSTGIK